MASSHEVVSQIMTFVHSKIHLNQRPHHLNWITQEIASYDPALPKRHWTGEISDSMTKTRRLICPWPDFSISRPFLPIWIKVPLARSPKAADIDLILLKKCHRPIGLRHHKYMSIQTIQTNTTSITKQIISNMKQREQQNHPNYQTPNYRQNAACESDCATSLASQHSWYQDCRRRYSK